MKYLSALFLILYSSACFSSSENAEKDSETLEKRVETYAIKRRAEEMAQGKGTFSITPLTHLRVMASHPHFKFPGKDSLLALTVLDLSDSKLLILPESISRLTNLTRLDASDNKLIDLPSGLNCLTQLRELDLSKNNLTTSSIFDADTPLASLTGLKVLSLATNEIKRLNSWFGNLTALERLDLSHNMFITGHHDCLPTSFTKLKCLTFLDHSYNVEIPHILAYMTNLKILRFTSNRIDQVPDDLFHGGLRELNLADNRLKKLPGAIRSATQLQKLYLERNPIECLPPAFTLLPELAEIHLEGCPVIDDLTYYSLKERQLLRGNPAPIKTKAPKTKKVTHTPKSKKESTIVVTPGQPSAKDLKNGYVFSAPPAQNASPIIEALRLDDGRGLDFDGDESDTYGLSALYSPRENNTPSSILTMQDSGVYNFGPLDYRKSPPPASNAADEEKDLRLDEAVRLLGAIDEVKLTRVPDPETIGAALCMMGVNEAMSQKIMEMLKQGK